MSIFLLLSLCLLALAQLSIICPTKNNINVAGSVPGVAGEAFLLGSQVTVGFNFSTSISGRRQDYTFYNLLFSYKIRCNRDNADVPVNGMIDEQFYYHVPANSVLPGTVPDQGFVVTITANDCLNANSNSFTINSPLLRGSVASNRSRSTVRVSMHITVTNPSGLQLMASGDFLAIKPRTYPIKCAPIDPCPHNPNINIAGTYPVVNEFDNSAKVAAGFVFTTPSDAGVQDYIFYNLTARYSLNYVRGYTTESTSTQDTTTYSGGHKLILTNFHIPNQRYNNVPPGTKIPIKVVEQSGLVDLPPSPSGLYTFGGVPPIITGSVASTRVASIAMVSTFAILIVDLAADSAVRSVATYRNYSNVISATTIVTYPLECAR